MGFPLIASTMEGPRIIINHQRITDAPYGNGVDSIFSFRDSDIRNFASELIYGNQTCYLISGYRGAGKTSFINRIEKHIQENNSTRIKRDKLGNRTSESYDLVFVKASFAKYSSQTAFLRQLIRNLYLCFKSPTSDHQIRLNELSPSVCEDFTKLFNRTFYDIRNNQEISNESSSSLETSIEAKGDKIVLGALTILLTCLPVSLVSLIDYFAKINPIWIKVVAPLASFLVAGFGYLKIKGTFTKSTTSKDSTTATEIYDDEIAFYHFETILVKLKQDGFKVVFVLDELDKVSDGEIDRLINEMKPYLLSGMADFIVVAGQRLTHKYISAQQADDAVISSLFSKVVHVPLKGVQDLRNTIYEHLIQNESLLTDEQKVQLLKFINATIYDSKRVPRAVFSKIRQSLEWDGSEASLKTQGTFEEDNDILEIIEDQVKKSIDPLSLEPAMKDYIIAQLYRVASMIQYVKGDSLKLSTVLKQYESSTEAYDLYYFVVLKLQIINLVFPIAKRMNIAIEIDQEIGQKEEQPETTKQTQDLNERVRSEMQELLRTFQNDFVQFNAITRKIYAVFGGTTNSKTTLLDILGHLRTHQKIVIPLPENDFVNKILVTPDILTDQSILEDSYNICQKAGVDFNSLSFNILERYVSMLTGEVLAVGNSTWADPETVKQIGADLVVQTNQVGTIQNPNVLLCVKYYRSGFGLNVSELTPILNRENNRTQKGNYFIVVIFTFDNKSTFDAIKYKLESELERVDRWLRGKIIFIIQSIADLENFKSELEEFKINKLKSYSPVIDYSRGREIIHKDDLQKERWGMQQSKNGLILECSQIENKTIGMNATYTLKLVVRTESRDSFEGVVIFFLHDTYDPLMIPVEVKDKRAELEISAYEAFTIGAVADGGSTELELDLSEVPNLPKEFKAGPTLS